MLLDLLLKGVNQLAQRQVELLAALKDGIGRSDLAVCLNFDFDVFNQRMSFLVASKSDSRVLQELVSEAISERVVLVQDHD